MKCRDARASPKQLTLHLFSLIDITEKGERNENFEEIETERSLLMIALCDRYRLAFI